MAEEDEERGKEKRGKRERERERNGKFPAEVRFARNTNARAHVRYHNVNVIATISSTLIKNIETQDLADLQIAPSHD